MKVLIAEDDPITLKMLSRMVSEWGYEVAQANDGAEAWEMAQADPAIQLVITDWMMPRMDGIELCKAVKGRDKVPYTYIIFLTVKKEKSDVAFGLDAGADDFMSKPVDRAELKSRLEAGRRVLNYESILGEKVAQLEKAFSEIKTLSGLLPICASCHKIRDDKGYWNQLEKYLHEHSNAMFTHGLCPDCVGKFFDKPAADH